MKFSGLSIGSLIAICATVCLIACQKPQSAKSSICETEQCFLQNLFEKKYSFVTNIGETQADALRQEIKVCYLNEQIFTPTMLEFEQIRTVRTASPMKYDSSKAMVDVINLSTTPDSITVEARISHTLTSNATDEDTGEKIVVAGYEIYRFILEHKNGSFVIRSEVKVDLTNTTGSIIDFINNNPMKLEVSDRAYSGITAGDWAIAHWNSIPTNGYYDYTTAGGLFHTLWLVVGFK